MHIAMLYDQGSAREQEDRYVIREQLFGIADGVSAPYESYESIRRFEGKTGGQIAAEIVCKILERPSISLRSLILQANHKIRQMQEVTGLSIKYADQLAGTTVAAVRLGDVIEIVQIGDAIVAWRLKDGRVEATRNQQFLHDRELLAIFMETMKSSHGNREEAWKHYLPISKEYRQRDANTTHPSAYGILNGQPQAERFITYQEFPKAGISTIILCSDGLVSFEDTESPTVLAQTMFGAYDTGGLQTMYESKRAKEAHMKNISHVSQTEISGIAIEL